MQTHNELFKNQMGWRQHLNRMSGLFLKMLHQNMQIQARMLAKPTQRWANRISNIGLLICGILITQLGRRKTNNKNGPKEIINRARK